MRTVPWLTPNSITILENHINSNSIVIEFGCGGSTIWLSKRVKTLITIEHNKDWISKVEPHVNKGTINYKELPYHDICKQYPNEYFDVSLVDGRGRIECVKSSAIKVKKGGILILDNAERKGYHPVHSFLKDWHYTGTYATDCSESKPVGIWRTDIWRKP